MKTSVTRTKRLASSVLTLTFIANIFTPLVTYAALPTFDTNLVTANQYPVAQVEEITVPRDPVVGDVLSLTVSGSTVTQNYDTSVALTLQFLNLKIDALPGVHSTVDTSSKKFTIISEIPGVAPNVGNLIITRAPITPVTTVNNVVAVAQQSEVFIPQDLFAGDVIQFTVAGTGITQAFTGSTDMTLAALAAQITAATNASGSYDNVARKVHLIAKIAGQAFSMSNLVITSSGMIPQNVVANVVPVAQVEHVTLPRILYNDETLHITVAGSGFTQAFVTDTQTTLGLLAAQIDALALTDATVSGSDIIVTAHTPGVPFTIGTLTITGGTISGITIVPNRVAVAQQDVISVPRDLFSSDTVHFRLNNINVTQNFSGSTVGTLDSLVALINQIPNVHVSHINYLTRTLTLASTVPGTPFTTQGLYLTTAVNSQNSVANVVAKAQQDTISFARNFRVGDVTSLVVDGNTITQSFTGDTNTTLVALAAQIDSMPSLVATADGIARKITITAANAGVGFNLSNTTLENTIAPTVLVANVVPVKQENTFQLPQQLLPGDSIDLTVDGNALYNSFFSAEATTLQNINTVINNISTVNSSVNLSSKSFTVTAATAGTPFTMSSIVSTSAAFSGVTLTGSQNEVKASASLNLNAVPVNGDSVTIGTCTVNFTDTGAVDTDCSNNNARINIAGITDTETVAAILRGLSGVHDDVNGVLNASGTGTNIIYTRSTTQDTLTAIMFDVTYMNGKMDILATPAPVIPVAQIDTLTLPRDFAPGDVFTTSIDGITVTQNYTSSSGVTLAVLVGQIDALPSVAASASGNVITITAATAGTPFILGQSQFINTQTPQVSISNTVAVAQSESLAFPVVLVTGDTVNLKINGTTVTQSFNSDSTTTLNDLVGKINGNFAGVVNASLSGSLTIVLDSAVAGQSFSIDALDLTNTTTPVNTQTNVAAVAQVDTLTLPVLPVSGDTISVNVNGTTVTQNYVADAATTLAALSTQIDNLASVNSSVNTASGIFTLTAKTPGTPFTASLLSTGATIDGATIVENTGAQAQVDTLAVTRQIASSDTLTLTLGSSSVTQAFTGSDVVTLGLLMTELNATQTGVTVAFDGPSKTFSFTANIPGTPFTHPVLTINSGIPSVNVVANVFAVAQVDTLTLQRSLLAGDTLTLAFSGQAFTQAFSGSEANTLAALKAQVDSGTTTTMTTAGNVLTFTAKTAGIPFHLVSFTVKNNVLPVTTVDNVAPVKQQTNYTLPTFIQGDTIAFSLNGTSIMQPFTGDNASTVAAILAQVNAAGSVDATFSGGIMNLISRVAGTPFTLSNATVTNVTASVITVVNVPARAQVVDFTPNGPVIEGLTYRVTINGTDYDYLTASGDTLPVIVNNLRSTITSTGVVATATGSSNDILEVTAAIPGNPFTYAAAVLDITPPIVSTPINIPQTLKSGDLSTSTVQSNENGVIYAVLSGSTVNTVGQLNTAVLAGHAFVVQSNAIKNTAYTFTVAHGIVDGKYDFIAIDGYNNVSQAFPGWLTVDNTAPIVTIGTPASTTAATQITITGSTNEPNRPFQIVYSGGILNGTVAADGTFSGTVTLALNTPNTITVNVTDVAGNIGTASVVITQDSLTPPLVLGTNNVYTNLSNITLTGSTDPNISVTVLDLTGVTVGSGFSDGSGGFAVSTPLVSNSVNTFTVIVTDAAQNSNSGVVTITQDSINPNIILDPVPSLIHAANVNISGTTEPFATLVLTNGTQPAVNVTASSTGAFASTVNLTPNSVNTIVVTATDLAGNVGTGSVDVTEDSVLNALLIHTPSQVINAANLTVSGSTKANSTVVIAGGSVTATGAADNSGNFSLSVALTRNAVNTLLVTSTDPVGFVATGSTVITEDSTNPTVAISTPSQTTNNLNITIQGTTEPNATIDITGGSGSFAGVSDGSGAFSVNVVLNPAMLNTLVVTATDGAGNIGTGSVAITHDPVVIFLNLAVANQTTNQNTFTFTGATKSGATLTITGGSGTVTTTADTNGDFTGTVTLNHNVANNILVTASDATSVTATGGFVITHDNIVPTIILGAIPGITAATSIAFSGTTEANAHLTFVNGTGSYTATADNAGVFGVTIPLNLNTLNTITGTAADLAGNVSTGVTIQITQDNLGPVVSNLAVTPFVAGNLMNANYTFTTNETAASTFFVGTGANVSATLIATGSTNGTTHTSVIPGLQANQTYYYYITSADVVGNTSQTPVAAINSIDTAGPVIMARNVSNILTTSATLDFTYTDADFVSPFATGSVTVTDGTNTLTFSPALTYSAPTMTGSVAFVGLTPATTYTYTATLADSFSNATTFSGSFTTVAAGILNGGTITQTGSIQIPTGTGTTQNLNGTTIILNSTDGTLTIGTGTTSIGFPAGWNGILQPPFLVNPSAPEAATNAELQPLVTPMNDASYTYAPNVIETIGVGGFPAPITSNGAPFTVTVNMNSNQVGQTLNVYRSTDGASWQANVPSGSCVVAANNTCTFHTNSLGYFALTQIIRTTRPSSGGGGGGGSYVPVDNCPNGDFTASYYDGQCGTKPATTATGTTTTTTTTTTLPNLGVNLGLPTISGNGENIKQDAVTYVTRIMDIIYPKLTNDAQKVSLWKKVAEKMDVLLKNVNLTDNQKSLYAAVKLLAEKLQKRIQDRINAQVIMPVPTAPIVEKPTTPIVETPVTPVTEKPATSTVVNLEKPGVVKEEQEGYIPASTLTTPATDTEVLPLLPDPEAPVYGGWKYVNAEHSQAVRVAPSYRASIFTYLPRNFKVEVTNMGALWSEINLENKSVFVRTKYLRDEKGTDAARHDPYLFQNLSQYTDIDVRKVRAYALNVRKGPSTDEKAIAQLREGTQVVILDRVDGWFEVRFPDSTKTGWVRSKFVK